VFDIWDLTREKFRRKRLQRASPKTLAEKLSISNPEKSEGVHTSS
jgi:hypothetical protein